MPLTFDSADQDERLRDTRVFVSASIPDATRWNGEFDALEITDAVVSLARALLTAGVRLVTAAHPTIAPLLLYVAAELPDVSRGRIVVYQSELFSDVLPAATLQFQQDGFGEMVWTPAAPGETPDPANSVRSLEIMRRAMFADTTPDAAIFIGGMEGIRDEWALFGETLPERPRYPIGHPGGAAAELVYAQSPNYPDLTALLSTGRVYPSVWRGVLSDLRRRL